MKKNKKKYIILLLLFVAVGMGIGYSLLQQQLKIQGTATVDDAYSVEITGIEQYGYIGTEGQNFGGSDGSTPGEASEISEPKFTATTANFNVKIGYGTSISYLITIKNTGNLNAVIKDVTKNVTGNAFVEVTTPIDINNLLLRSGESLQYVVTISYKNDENLSEQTEKEANISITINTEQTSSSTDYDTINFIKPQMLIADADMNGDFVVDVLNTYENIEFLYSVDDGEFRELKNAVSDGEACWMQKAANEPIYKKFMVSVLGDTLKDGSQHKIKVKCVSGSDESNVVTFLYYYHLAG